MRVIARAGRFACDARMHRRAAFFGSIALVVLSARCGGGPASSDAVPFVTSISPGTSVRNIVVTQYAGSTQAGEPAACSLEADLFDVTTAANRATTMTDGDCALYADGAPLSFDGQNWICAGAVVASYGGRSENLTYCPSGGLPFRRIGPLDCTGLNPGTSVAISSADDIDGDVLTDLQATVTLPGAISITQPTTLGVVTWPASGSLDVRWSSENAGSALVTIEARSNPSGSPMIVCHPGANGSVTVAAALVDAGGFRTRESMLRVFSYRDTTVTAEGSHEYRVWGAVESGVLLQAMR